MILTNSCYYTYLSSCFQDFLRNLLFLDLLFSWVLYNLLDTPNQWLSIFPFVIFLDQILSRVLHLWPIFPFLLIISYILHHYVLSKIHQFLPIFHEILPQALHLISFFILFTLLSVHHLFYHHLTNLHLYLQINSKSLSGIQTFCCRCGASFLEIQCIFWK